MKLLQKKLFLDEAEALAPTDETAPAQADEEDATPVAGHQRKQRGRKPLDPALPRETVRHELPEAERVCAHDGHALVEIVAEISEQMDVIPEQVRVLQHHRIKYACPCCDLSLKIAPTPARIIRRGLGGATDLAGAMHVARSSRPRKRYRRRRARPTRSRPGSSGSLPSCIELRRWPPDGRSPGASGCELDIALRFCAR